MAYNMSAAMMRADATLDDDLNDLDEFDEERLERLALILARKPNRDQFLEAKDLRKRHRGVPVLAAA